MLFLLDENLSPRLVAWLKRIGYDAKPARAVGLKGKSDEDIISWIKKNNAVIITSDLDFGEFFYFRNLGNFGVIILRSRSQSISAFKKLILKLHRDGVLNDSRLIHSLVVIDEKGYRWRQFNS